jgi:hypothetical protein
VVLAPAPRRPKIDADMKRFESKQHRPQLFHVKHRGIAPPLVFAEYAGYNGWKGKWRGNARIETG